MDDPWRKGSPHWLKPILDFPSSQATLDTSLQALAFSRCGTIYDYKNLRLRGESLYLKSLSLLHHAVSQQDLARIPETLAAANILILYELTDQEDGCQRNGFAAHLSGVSTLFLLRGSEDLQSPMTLALFEHSRYIFMIQGLLRRKASVFSSSEWITAPWKGTNKAREQQILDQGFALGILIDRSDVLTKANAALKCEFEHTFKDLMKVYEDIEELLGQPLQLAFSSNNCFSGSLISIPNPAETVVHTTALALQLMAFTTACIVLRRLCRIERQEVAIPSLLGHPTTEAKTFFSPHRGFPKLP